MRFAFVHNWRHIWRIETICRVMRVSTRGYRSWRSRPMSQRDRTDMKVLAHIREQSSLSLGSYGRPRMTMELKEVGLDVGERRVGRLMRINGIKPVRTRKHKPVLSVSKGLRPTATTIWGLPPTCWMVTSWRMRPTVNGQVISPISGRQRVGSIWR